MNYYLQLCIFIIIKLQPHWHRWFAFEHSLFFSRLDIILRERWPKIPDQEIGPHWSNILPRIVFALSYNMGIKLSFKLNNLNKSTPLSYEIEPGKEQKELERRKQVLVWTRFIAAQLNPWSLRPETEKDSGLIPLFLIIWHTSLMYIAFIIRMLVFQV